MCALWFQTMMIKKSHLLFSPVSTILASERLNNNGRRHFTCINLPIPPRAPACSSTMPTSQLSDCQSPSDCTRKAFRSPEFNLREPYGRTDSCHTSICVHAHLHIQYESVIKVFNDSKETIHKMCLIQSLKSNRPQAAAHCYFWALSRMWVPCQSSV